MQTRRFILILSIVVLVNIPVQWCFFRIDLTSDHRHSLSEATCRTLRQMESEAEIKLYLSGNLNSGFLQLQSATREVLGEMSQYGKLRVETVDINSLSKEEEQQLQQTLAQYGLQPTAIYERDKRGTVSQTIVYPFASVTYQGRRRWLSLLQNQRGLSGAENLNRSVEGLEYNFAQAIHTLQQKQRQQVAFLEGHGELPEQNTQDVQLALAQWFDVYRGTITDDADLLSPFKAIIIADPQLPFSERDKFVIDQYLMKGGSLLWCLNGVQFSQDNLSKDGFTPILALDLNLSDMLFRYGVRINPRLVQSLQCLSVPVDVSQNPDIPQYEPIPWVNAPLLETAYSSAVTRNISPVSATFCSDIDFVGGDDDILKNVLLATSDYSRTIATPQKIDLTDLSVEPGLFSDSYLTVAASLEGSFPSLFKHRLPPENVVTTQSTLKQSVPTKQIVAACGSIPRNEVQQGQTLPAGYDRYSRMQFGNRDFIVNSILWLTDDANLIALRQKEIPLRLLNEKRVQQNLLLCQTLSTILPLLLLAVAAVVVMTIRKHKYSYK